MAVPPSAATAPATVDSASIGLVDSNDSGSSDGPSQFSGPTLGLSPSMSLLSPYTSSPCSSPQSTSSVHLSPSSMSVSSHPMSLLRLLDLFLGLWTGLYGLLQDLIIFCFAKPLPPSTSLDPHPQPLARIAIIGAGITGISSAAHFLSHGFEVVIFEQSASVGGIWARVNSTSSLQLDSFMYRFHPSVKWSNHFPVKRVESSAPPLCIDEILGRRAPVVVTLEHVSSSVCPLTRFSPSLILRQAEILDQVHKVWDHYRLTSRTRLNVTVHSVNPVKTSGEGTQWTVNDGAEGVFDAVVVAAGTCGPPRRVAFPGREAFQGTMVHSSQLDQVDWTGKRVVVVGGGASAVEALELAVSSGCLAPAVLVTRTDKWFIPRNLILGTLLASNSIGVPSLVDKLAEKLVRTFHYGPDLEWMSPAAYDGKPPERLYSKTPIVNGEFLKLVREKRADYVRAKINKISPRGLEVHRFGSQQPEEIRADVIVEATGYHRPNLDFLPMVKLFSGPKGPDQYAAPNLFLQNFLAKDWTCLMTNAGYYEGIGSVGHSHIGVLARMMMMFLLDKPTAPKPAEMRAWVDRVVGYKGTLTFFTWSWLVFVATGWGSVGGTRKPKTL